SGSRQTNNRIEMYNLTPLCRNGCADVLIMVVLFFWRPKFGPTVCVRLSEAPSGVQYNLELTVTCLLDESTTGVHSSGGSLGHRSQAASRTTSLYFKVSVSHLTTSVLAIHEVLVQDWPDRGHSGPRSPGAIPGMVR